MVAAALALGVAALLHARRRVAEQDGEPPWRSNDDARLEICLSQLGAPGSGWERTEADLSLEGTLVGVGELSGDAHAPGYVVACEHSPERYVDVRDGENETWRIMYAFSGVRYPVLRARLGAHVHFRFFSAFHAGRTADLLLTDEAGPVLAIEQDEFGPRDLAGAQLTVGWGTPVGSHRSPCGGDETARALRVSGDTEAMVPPGQTGSVRLHGMKYRLWNVVSVDVTGVACPDEDDVTTWLLWRE